MGSCGWDRCYSGWMIGVRSRRRACLPTMPKSCVVMSERDRHWGNRRFWSASSGVSGGRCGPSGGAPSPKAPRAKYGVLGILLRLPIMPALNLNPELRYSRLYRRFLMRKETIVRRAIPASLAAIVVISCTVPATADYPLTFKGTASGRTLILGKIAFGGTRFVSIDTTPGESPESAARRLTEAIATANAAIDTSPNRTLWAGRIQPASGPNVRLPGYADTYYTAGTETGLGIPRAPLFLTAICDKTREELKLHWENADGAYDEIFATVLWRRGRESFQAHVPGASNSLVVSRKNIPDGFSDMQIAVVGCRNGIVSAPAAIHVMNHYQDEAFAIPFARGVMPNWAVWHARQVEAGAVVPKGQNEDLNGRPFFKAARRWDYAYYADDGLDAKPFYQVIRADPLHPLGIYRKFLGLTSGHTYRLTAALSSLELDYNPKNEWAFSVHASHGPPDGKSLTVNQMSGNTTLPDGSKGPAAGRIIASGRLGGHRIGGSVGPGFRLPRNKPQAEDQTDDDTDVTLPDGIDTLIVWVRFECSDPDAEVGFMGVGLEDITATQGGQERPKEGPGGPKRGQ